MVKRHESLEDYLERILMLSKKLTHVRSIDIATDMSFSKPSISIAMKKLKQEDYITIDENGYIFLTEKGLKVASEVYERHTIITNALIALGVNETQAKQDACLIEHDLSKESFECIKAHYLKSKNN